MRAHGDFRRSENLTYVPDRSSATEKVPGWVPGRNGEHNSKLTFVRTELEDRWPLDDTS
jgi:hypothetical protein